MTPNSTFCSVLIIVLITCDVTADTHCLKCTSENDQHYAEGSHPISKCLPEEDRCYTRLVGGHVVRGCLLDLSPAEYYSCLSDGTCRSCLGSGCNRAYWPKCHQCDAGDSGCDEVQVNSPEFCGKISGLNFCYARLENGLVTRGCGFSDPLCITEPESCQICHIDGCNGLARDALKPSKCQRCSASTEQCIAGNSSKLSGECSRLADSCFTAITSIASSSNVLRGCSEQIGNRVRTCANSLNDHPLCVSCQGDNCNGRAWLRCHQCKVTNLDSSCTEEQVAPAMFCASQRVDNRCYTRVVNGFFERGCLSDFDANVDVCNKPGIENCHLCAGQACNSRANSAVNVAKLNSLIMVFIVILLLETVTLFS